MLPLRQHTGQRRNRAEARLKFTSGFSIGVPVGNSIPPPAPPPQSEQSAQLLCRSSAGKTFALSGQTHASGSHNSVVSAFGFFFFETTSFVSEMNAEMFCRKMKRMKSSAGALGLRCLGTPPTRLLHVPFRARPSEAILKCSQDCAYYY